MLRFISILLIASIAAIAQTPTSAATVSGTTSPVKGETATAAFTPVPTVAWKASISCVQRMPLLDTTTTTGTKWDCTLMSNKPAPTGGFFTFTFDPTTVWQIVPSPVIVSDGTSSATFTLTGL